MNALFVNTRTVDITGNDELKLLERDWVVALLASLRGVENVRADEQNPRRLESGLLRGGGSLPPADPLPLGT